MDAIPRVFAVLDQVLHRHVLVLAILSYALAAGFPAVGLVIKDACIASAAVGSLSLRVTAPALLLSFLLLSAGLRVRSDRLRAMVRQPAMILAGIIANLSVPVVYLLALMPVLGYWHNPDEATTIVLGLALVASMPVAGSSTGWAQHAGGDMALSLGLVVASTLLSPLTTPWVLQLLGSVSPHQGAADLRLVASRETGMFLLAWVLIPSLLGMALRRLLTVRQGAAIEQHLKPLATLTLLVLCYANASACLPQAFGNPDWDFLVAVIVAVLGMCALTFSIGYTIGCLFGADHKQRVALMFGMGMNNNGTGLVLASVALSSRPVAVLPIIVYNLGQHLVAGCVDGLSRRSTGS
jgi:BASS family bile acid:Na+ symporter